MPGTAWNKVSGLALPLQVLEEVPPAGGQHFGDCAGYGRSDERDRLQRIAPTLLGDSAEIIVQNAD